MNHVGNFSEICRNRQVLLWQIGQPGGVLWPVGQEKRTQVVIWAT
jgi:hypothetical protein